MIRTLAVITGLFISFGLFTSTEGSTYLSEVQHSITTPTKTDQPFDLGGNRTVHDAFDSSAFTYDGKRF